jgi:4-amino-4-deoxy-L-arabinose transferase-like glycosyltransferase
VSPFRRKYVIVGILCLGFFLRIGLLLKTPNFDYTHFEGDSLPSEVVSFRKARAHDSQEYKALALNMLEHRKFSWNSRPVTVRPPAYPAFIAFVYSLFGTREWVVMFFQVLLSVASIGLIYAVGKNIGNETGGLVAASLFSIDSTSILFSSLFMSETLFVFCVLIGVLLFVTNRRLLSGLAFGISVLVRPIALYIFVPVVILQRKLGDRVFFLLLFLLPVLPWMARNLSVYGSPLLTSNQGFNLFFMHAAFLESEKRDIGIERAQEELSKELPDSLTNPLKLASFAQRTAIKRIVKSPFRYASICLKGWVWMLLSTKSDDIILRLSGTSIAQSRLLVHGLRGTENRLMVLLPAGIEVSIIVACVALALVAFIRSPGVPNLLFFLIVLYFSVASGPLGESRYRLPLIPYVYLLAANIQWARRR